MHGPLNVKPEEKFLKDLMDLHKDKQMNGIGLRCRGGAVCMADSLTTFMCRLS